MSSDRPINYGRKCYSQINSSSNYMIVLFSTFQMPLVHIYVHFYCAQPKHLHRGSHLQILKTLIDMHSLKLNVLNGHLCALYITIATMVPFSNTIVHASVVLKLKLYIKCLKYAYIVPKMASGAKILGNIVEKA